MRPATAGDVDDLVALMAEFYAESSMPLDVARARASFEALLGQPALGAAWLLDADQQVAGYIVITFTFSMEYGGPSAFVDDLFVRPAFRRRGLARAAIEGALAECRARGVHAAHLEVGRDNDPAMRLYQSVGFAATDRLLLTARLIPSPSHHPAPPRTSPHPTSDLSLLNPEWQGYGVDASVHDGALAVAGELFPDEPFVRVDAPRDERLVARDGVLGLDSIAPRCRRTLDALRHRAPDRILHIAGTCGAELAPVAYLNERYGGALAVVWLDAHGDLNTPDSSPSGHFHGMVLRTLLGRGPAPLIGALRRPLRPDQVFLAGTRDLDPPEAQFVTSAGVSVTTCDELADAGLLASRIAEAGFKHVYAHLDLDVLDPGQFPDSLIQTPGGLAPRLAAAVLAALNERLDLAGLSVVEYRPRSSDGLSTLRQLLADSGIRIGALGLA